MRIEPVASNWIVLRTESGEVFDLYDTGTDLCVKAWQAQGQKHHHVLSVTTEDIVTDKREHVSGNYVVRLRAYSET